MCQRRSNIRNGSAAYFCLIGFLVNFLCIVASPVGTRSWRVRVVFYYWTSYVGLTSRQHLATVIQYAAHHCINEKGQACILYNYVLHNTILYNHTYNKKFGQKRYSDFRPFIFYWLLISQINKYIVISYLVESSKFKLFNCNMCFNQSWSMIDIRQWLYYLPNLRVKHITTLVIKLLFTAIQGINSIFSFPVVSFLLF